MTDDDAIACARRLGITARPVEGERAAGATAMIATEVLDQHTALGLYRTVRATRATTGLSALLVEPEALQRADAAALASYPALTVGAVLHEVPEILAACEAALDELGVLTDTDPMLLLHRIPLLDIAAVESGEIEDPFDEIGLLPEDVGEAYRQQLAERAQLVAGTRGLTMIASQARTPDEAAALAEIACGPTHLVLVAGSPARALLQLGFGGFNDCPSPAAHARIWEYWHTRHGAEPVVVGRDRLGGLLSRPVLTRPELVQLAAEVVSYDIDTLAEGPLYLLATLYRNATFDFWWD